MRIIGVDPGSRFLGYGIVEKQGSSLIHIDNGVIIPRAGETLPKRLYEIEKNLDEIIYLHRPDAASVEDVFMHKNWRSALTLGQARGAALVALARGNLEVNSYAPTAIKKAVVGNGRAAKEQVQHMVRIILGLPEVPEENAADALAMAICHLQSGPSNWEDLIK